MGSTGAPIAQKGAMLAAVASLLRFYQARGDLPSIHGLADVAALNQFLGSACVFDAHAGQICDGYLLAGDDSDPVVNLWRLAAFTGGSLDISIESPLETVVRDLVAAGDPVLLALGLSVNGAATGSHFVVATGVAQD
ncbi:MAG: hypothetical protein NTY38_15895, partial [Acidobacteria bacterium]|nr:hypothetical protein [Acidobacteriota bacterium]